MKNSLKKIKKLICRKQNGTVSVLLCLLLVPVMMVALIATDFARIYSSRAVISDSLDMAMNAALAGYDATLMDRYGLFAMEPNLVSDERIRELYIENLNASTISELADYEHILSLLNEDFEIIKVNNSQIYKTEVEKQQIVEYMKYRAPVCLTDEFLGKLKSIKEQRANLEAIERQIDFAESMETVQESFEKAQKNLDQLNENVKKYRNLRDVNDVLGEVAQNYKQYYYRWALVAEMSDNIKNIYISDSVEATPENPGKLNNEIARFYSYVGSCRTAIQAWQNNYNDPVNAAENAIIAFYHAYKSMSIIDNSGGLCAIEPSDEDVDYSNEKAVEAFNERHTAWENRLEPYDNYCDYVSSGFKKAIKNSITLAIAGDAGKLSQYYKLTEESYKLAAEVLGQLTDVENALTVAKACFDDWDGAVNGKDDKPGLSDTPEKVAMNESLDEYRGFFSWDYQAGTDAMSELGKLRILVQDDKDFFTQVNRILQYEKSCEKSVINDKSDIIYAAMLTAASTVLGGEPQNWWWGADSDRQQVRTMLDYYQGELSPYYEHQEVETSCVLHSLDENQFYQNLKSYCEKASTLDDEKAQKEAKKTLDDGVGGADEANDDKSFPQFDWSEVSQKLASTELGYASFEQKKADVELATGNVSNKKERDNVIAKARTAISNATGFLDAINQLAEQGLESVYVAEYAMQMFSYYNCDKKMNTKKEIETIKEEELLTISGYPLKNDKAEKDEEENTPYKGELEYIIWGNQTTKANITSSMILIFGIRLIFNSIFTFTDNYVRWATSSSAAAITAATPYLKPIVDVVLKFGFALAESAIDIWRIKNGYGVDLVKHTNSFQALPNPDALETPDVRNGTPFDYREYLRLFLIIKYLSGENKMLARMADCIQVNTTSNILEEYTMVAAGTTVGVRTSFLQKASDYGKQYSLDGQETWNFGNKYSMRVQSILGY